MGVFQCESSGFRDLLKRLRPDTFSDIIALVALYRPGPLGGGMVDDFVERKHGRAAVEYKHPLLEPILRETYGVMAYQEQVMQILNRLGGMSMSDSYSCIKAISKKKTDVIEARREAFYSGAAAKGVSGRVATEVFDLITFFGGYGFNKSHSTCYALLAYQTAYLKANWPVEFFAATMTFEMGDTTKLELFIKNARNNGLDILPPDVNRSVGDFQPEKTPDGAWAVRYGLAALKGVGTKPVEALVAARAKVGAFKSLFHLAENVDVHSLTKAVLEILVKAGALDSLGGHRAQLSLAVPQAIEAGAVAQADRRAGQATFFGGLAALEEKAPETKLPNLPEWTVSQLGAFEKEVFGFHYANQPLDEHQETIERYSTAQADALADLPDRQDVMIGGSISAVKNLTTKKGDPMGRFLLTTLSGDVAVVVFPEAFAASRELIRNDAIVLLRGSVDRSNDPPGLIAAEIVPIQEADARLARKMLIDVASGALDDAAMTALADVIAGHRGRIPVVFRISTPAARTVLSAGPEFCVSPSQELVAECEELVGAGHVAFAGGPLAPSNGNGNGNGGRRWSRRGGNGY